MSNVSTPRTQYRAMAQRWVRCRDVIAGDAVVKMKPRDYLPCPSGMDRATFAAYAARPSLFPAAGRTVAALTGVLTQRAPSVVGIDDGLRAQLADLTGADGSLGDVLAWLVRDLLTVGRAAVLVDLPSHDGYASPYWVPLVAESLINWRTGPVGDDPSALVQAVIREDTTVQTPDGFGHQPVTRYRELALIDGEYRVRVWAPSDVTLVRDTSRTPYLAGEWIVPTRRGTPLPFLPLVIVGPRGLSPDVDSPPLEDLVSLVLSHFANAADLEHGLHYTSLPTPWVSGLADPKQKLRIGPSVCWVLEKDGKAGMVEFSGAGLGAIRETMAMKEQAMAIAGSRLLLEAPSAAASETATSAKLRHASEVASLRTIADATSQALTAALRLHAWWEGSDTDLPTDVRVDLPRDFFVPGATAEEVKTLLLLLQSQSISYETFYFRLARGGWVREHVTADEERADIATDDALTPDPAV